MPPAPVPSATITVPALTPVPEIPCPIASEPELIAVMLIVPAPAVSVVEATV